MPAALGLPSQRAAAGGGHCGAPVFAGRCAGIHASSAPLLAGASVWQRASRGSNGAQNSAPRRRANPAAPLRRGRFQIAQRNPRRPDTRSDRQGSRGRSTSLRQRSYSPPIRHRRWPASWRSAPSATSARAESRRTSGRWAGTCRSAYTAGGPSNPSRGASSGRRRSIEHVPSV